MAEAAVVLVVLAGVALGALSIWRRAQNYVRSGAGKQMLRDAHDRIVPERSLRFDQVQRVIFRAMIVCNTVGVHGTVRRPDHYLVSVSDGDNAVLADVLEFTCRELAEAIDLKAEEEGWTIGRPATVEIVRNPSGRNGRPTIRPSFADAPRSLDKTVAVIPDGHDGSNRTERMNVPSFIGIDAIDGLAIRPRLGDPTLYLGRAHQPELERFNIVSSDHCRFDLTGDGWIVTDVSLNGTLVDGEPVSTRLLRPGQVIQLAPAGPRLRFELDAPAGA